MSIEDKFQKEKKLNEDTIKKQKDEYERKLRELEEKMIRVIISNKTNEI